MKIEKEQNGSELTLKVIGELNTMTATELERELKTSLTGVTSLVLDFAELEYVSSAGLRVILSAQNVMDKQGKMTVKSPNEEVREVFDVTGFSDFLNIE